jgi:hypothetical protein
MPYKYFDAPVFEAHKIQTDVVSMLWRQQLLKHSHTLQILFLFE